MTARRQGVLWIFLPLSPSLFFCQKCILKTHVGEHFLQIPFTLAMLVSNSLEHSVLLLCLTETLSRERERERASTERSALPPGPLPSAK